MHIKPDTNTLKVSDLVEIYNTIWSDKEYNIDEKLVYEMIMEETSLIISETSEKNQLENKIVLSIAIRLKAEEFMIAKINSEEEVLAISKNQTTELMRLYKNRFPEKTDEIKVLEQVNLMTAENIHINAFMYEPILDLSDTYLKGLFDKVINLN